MHNECERRRVEVLVCHVLGQQVEEHDCIRRGVAERAAGVGRDDEWARARRVGLGAAPEMDDRGVQGKRGKAECAERDEVRNLVAFVVDDPHDLELILAEVGNDECILSEEAEAGVGAPFEGLQLDTNGALISKEGRSYEILTRCASPFFQRTRKNISAFASRTD